MDKYFLSLSFLVVITSISQSIAHSLVCRPVPIDQLLFAPREVTNITFYMQADDTGGNETAYRIANSSITNTSPTMFGFLDMADFYLTETSDPKSNTVGRAQGIFGSADLNQVAYYNNLIVYFTSGVYNGSTLHVVGRVPVYSSYIELSISGGTQCFRLATGIVTFTTISLMTNAQMIAILEVNATVIHPFVPPILP